MQIRKHLDLLGFPVEDRVTGFKGVVATVAFDLYGCVQAVVNPGLNKEGKLGDQIYFDVSRLKVTGDRVMDPPNYDFGEMAEGKYGPAEKPAPYKA